MTNEFTDVGPIGAKESPSPKQTDLGDVFDKGFKMLPELYTGDLHKRFEYDFPFSTTPLGKRLLQAITHKQVPRASNIKLDELTGLKQQTGSDCAGAITMSVFSTITGVTVTPEIYENFLQVALKHGMATKDDQGIKVLPFALNLLMTPDFRNKFLSEVRVAYRKNLSPEDLSMIVNAAKEKASHRLFVLMPFTSENIARSGHLVALQEISPEGITVYDPKIGEKQTLSYEETERRRKYDENSAIFVFARGLTAK